MNMVITVDVQYFLTIKYIFSAGVLRLIISVKADALGVATRKTQ